MRIYEPHAVYDWRDNIVGFTCQRCSKVVQSMMGDTCNECREKSREYQKFIDAITGSKKP